MSDQSNRSQPEPVSLDGIDPSHPDPESPQHLVGVAAAETARGVDGVHALGNAVERTLDRASRRVLGSSVSPGVTVSMRDGTTVIDLELIVDYPRVIAGVVEETRDQVARAARQIVSGPVVVNIDVFDVHGPFDDQPVAVPDDEVDAG